MTTLRSIALLLGAAAALVGCDNGGPATTCTPETDLEFCTRQGRECDMVIAFDNCGTSRTVNCGMCDAPETCGGGGMANVCGMPGDAGPGDAGPGDAGPPDGGCPLCPTGDYWVHTIFTISTNEPIVNGNPYTHAFDEIVGVPVELRINFASTTESQTPGSPPFMPNELGIATGPTTTVTSEGPAVLSAIAANLAGRTASIQLGGMGTSVSSSFAVWGPDGLNIYGIEITCTTSDLTVGGDGYPTSAPYACSAANITLRRYTATTSMMTDYATGTATFEYHQP